MPRKSDSKKSFKIFNDYVKKVDLLSDEEAGQLFKAILAYVNNTEVVPEFEDRAMKMAFTDFQDQFDRDKAAYDWQCKVNRQNGEKGGRPKQEFRGQMSLEDMEPKETEENRTEPKKPNRLLEEPKKKPSPPEYSEGFKQIWEMYPRKENKAESYRNYQRRIKDGYSPEQLYEAVRKYCEECRKENKPKQFTYKLRTFLDVSGEFTTYLPRSGSGSEDPKEDAGNGYEEVDFRDFM